ncbi:MAG: glutaredoxin [Gammaproteobacteria bacterium]|nr:glutaredoxin [Gammaproteobacteria bacterium]
MGVETIEVVEEYQLFKTDICGFCHRVRWFLSQHNIDIPLRDVSRDPDAFRELLQYGGRTTVPCLRIQRGDEVEWMFESADIMAYLARRFGF